MFGRVGCTVALAADCALQPAALWPATVNEYGFPFSRLPTVRLNCFAGTVITRPVCTTRTLYASSGLLPVAAGAVQRSATLPSSAVA